MPRDFLFPAQIMLSLGESRALLGATFELVLSVDDDRIASARARVGAREHVLGVDNLRVMLGEEAFEQLKQILDV